jgi:hypothetical protein
MELIELSVDDILNALFDAKKDPIEIWKNAVEYPRLRQHARKMLSCFSTTYCCESTLSYLTQIKTKYSNAFQQKADTTKSLKG